MRLLTASEAISPAMERTRKLLFENFRLGTFLKLSIIALFAEGASGGCNFNGGIPGRQSGSGGGSTANSLHLPPGLGSGISHGMPHIGAFIALIAVIGLFVIVIGLVLAYLLARLKLSLLHMVATRDTRLGPSWSRYGAAAFRLFGLELALSLGAIAVILAVAFPFILRFLRLRALAGNANSLGFDLHGFLPAILIGLLAVFVFFILLWIVKIVIRDFMVPPIALEDASISLAWQRARDIIAPEPGQFIVYLFFKIILAIAFAIVSGLLLVIAVLISAIPAGILAVVVWLALRHAGTGGHILMFALAFLGLLLAFAWLLLLIAATSGPVAFFKQCYSAYFVGSRYSPLGNLLEPPPPPPPSPVAPVIPPPEPPPFIPPTPEPAVW